jgi:hypothetical protein
VSGVFQTQPGPERVITETVTKAQLPLLTTASAVSVQLTPPGSFYFPRMYQTDLSASWTARIDKLKLKPSVELFNLFNANYVLTETSVYPTQARPLTILPGRLLRLSVSFDF